MTGRASGHLKGTIAANITAAMTAKGLSAADLMRQTDFHERAVRRWQKGEVTPSLENMQRLAELLGRPVQWFYTDHADAESDLEPAA